MDNGLEVFGKRWNSKTKAEVAFAPEAEALAPGAIPLGIPAVDLMLGGGLPRGRTSIFIGEPSSGKSLLAQLVIAAAQRKGGKCIYFDIERCYDAKWMALTGVDVSPEKLLVMRPRNLEQCVTRGHKVLRENLTWANVEDIKPGDRLIGLDEYPVRPSASRKLRATRVVANLPLLDVDVWRIMLDNGVELVATGEHRWLVRGSKGPAWLRTDHLKPGRGIFTRILTPWEVDRSWEAGWLAGFFDGEGTMVQRSGGRPQIQISQKAGPLRDLAYRLLQERGWSLGKIPEGRYSGNLIGPDKLRFLGQIRPQKFLSKLDTHSLGSIRRTRDHADYAQVIAVEPAGKQTVFGLSTDIGTYIVEGYPAHNTFDMVISALEELKPEVIVVDSVPAMVPEAILKASMEDKDFRGLAARKTTEGIAKCTSYNQKTALIFINQLRMDMGVTWGNPERMPGGKAIKFHASLIIRVRRGKWLTDVAQKLKEEEFTSLEEGKDAKRIGFMLRLRTEKSKVSPPWQTCELRFYFNGTVDPLGSLVHLAIQRGLIVPTGSYYELPGFDQKIHGLSAVEEAIRENDEIKAELVSRIKEIS